MTGCGLIPALLMAVLAVEVRRTIPLSTVVMGGLLASTFVSAGLTAVLGAAYCQRAGWRSAGRSAALSALGALAMCALAQNVVMLFAGMVLAGVAISVGTPGGVLLLATAVPAARRGQAFGLNSAAMPLATLLAGIALPVASGALGWRATFLVGAAWPAATLLLTAGARHRDGLLPRGAPRGRASTSLRLATAGAGLGTFSLGAATGFFVLTAVGAGISQRTAAAAVVLGSAGGLVTRLINGWWLDRMRGSGFALAGWVLLASAAGYLGLATARLPVLVAAGVVVFAAGLGWHSAFYLAVARTDAAAPAAATGFAQIGVSAGAALGPVSFGTVDAALGMPAAWCMAAACALVGGAVMLRAASTS